MPAISESRAKYIRFGTDSPRRSSRCGRCGDTFQNHEGIRCVTANESVEHYQNFLLTGRDDQITSRGPGRTITENEAFLLRFGCSGEEASSRDTICRRCNNNWGLHQEARCFRAEESIEHYQEFLRTGLDDHEYPITSNNFKPIKLGADPEFELHDNAGRFIHASEVITSGTGRNWGTDGNSSTGELRTDPGNPDVVLKSISTILDYGNTQVGSRYSVFAGSGKNVPLGGHIHFSGIEPDRKLLNLLDTFITNPLREISNTSRRDQTGYGRLGEYRAQPHGWEYRSPCSWISHPLIARGVLTVAYELALSFQENSSINFANTDEFINFVRLNSEDSANKIAEFYKLIEKLKAKKVKLEQVEVFQAWSKRPRPELKPQPVTKLIYTWNLEHRFMPGIKELVEARRTKHSKEASTSITMNVVGASKERSLEQVIFVPDSWVSKIPHRIAKVKVQIWDKPDIGLSYELRRNLELSSEVLNFIKYYILSRSAATVESVIEIIEGETTECAV
jgi:hypothetical protein